MSPSSGRELWSARVGPTRVFTPEVASVTGPSFVNGRPYVRNIREMAAFHLSG